MSNPGGNKEFEETTKRSQESGARIQEALGVSWLLDSGS
jgi:hypothetical protein